MSLLGKRVLVTRGEEQAEEFATLIRGRGGVPVLFPTVRLAFTEEPGPLDRALASLSSYDWVLFASANGARFFCDRMARRGIPQVPGTVRVGSVGPGTSRELSRHGIPVHLEAARHTAEGLTEALARDGVAGRRFLLPRAKEGREVLADTIARLGGTVEAVVTYRNAPAERDEEAARRIVASPPDVCTFASPSAFRNFFLLLGEDRAAAILARSLIAVIGEVSARAVRKRNYRVDIVPETYTLNGLLDAIEGHFAARM